MLVFLVVVFVAFSEGAGVSSAGTFFSCDSCFGGALLVFDEVLDFVLVFLVAVLLVDFTEVFGAAVSFTSCWISSWGVSGSCVVFVFLTAGANFPRLLVVDGISNLL